MRPKSKVVFAVALSRLRSFFVKLFVECFLAYSRDACFAGDLPTHFMARGVALEFPL